MFMALCNDDDDDDDLMMTSPLQVNAEEMNKRKQIVSHMQTKIKEAQ